MKRYCDACRHYCDEAAMFCPTCGQYTVATEVERIAPEGDVIYPLSHYQLSYKDTFLYVMGTKFMDTDGRASRREFFQFLLLWHIAIVGLLVVFYGLTAIFHTGPYLIGLAGLIVAILSLVSLMPLIALSVRRLHDTGKGSATLLLFLIPFVGPLIVLGLLCLKGQPQDNQYGSALQHLVIDKRLASIMKVSPTSSALTTRVLVGLLVVVICVFGTSLRAMGPANEVFPDGWFTNSIVGAGSVEASRASVQNYFDAVNNKDYDKAFTYIISQASTNPVEKQKWLESMKQAPKVDVVSLGVTRVSRTGDLKRIVFDANLQTTKVGAGVVESTPMKRYISVIEENGAWRIEGFYKTMPDDDK